MAIGPGARLGPYHVIALIGEGGMGEVYRATDTNLKRTVALKVLPTEVASDAERIARFQREAEVLARLDHPNIAQIHGLETSDGTTALVMEFVDGPTLAESIAACRANGSAAGLPMDEALVIATQIVEALEAAHRQGIVHRDLKPANIKVRPDGAVKVLDFGLAKATEPPHAQTPGASQSPTITSPAHTRAGVILGTAAYMSPEQAKGQGVDSRADVWAFGVVLFEMLSGRRPFDGADVADVLGAVLRLEPNWHVLPPRVPPRVERVLHACLQKGAQQRLASMQDVRLALAGAFDTSAAPGRQEMHRGRRSWWSRSIPLAAAAFAGAAVTASVLWPSAPEPARVSRFSHTLPSGLDFRGRGRSVFAVSPDGRRLVYNTAKGLYLRSMEEPEERLLLPGTAEMLSNPFFSSDGQSVGYFQGGYLKRLALTAGAPVTIAPATNPFGVSWTEDDTIYFAQPEGIMRVAASGGAPELVVAAAAGELLDGPQLLPDGDTLLFTAGAAASAGSGSSRWDSAQIAVHSLRSGERRILLRNGSDAQYLDSGHLVYAFRDELFAVPFDARARVVRGEPASVVQGVIRATVAASANYAVSRDGTLFRAVDYNEARPNLLGWVDRGGKVERITTVRPNVFLTPRLSPDGRRALVVTEGDLRVYDLASGRETRLTFDGATAAFAAWRPDGHMVAYSSSRSGAAGTMNVWIQPADGSGNATQVTTLDGTVHLESWAPDGRTLAVHLDKLNEGPDVVMIPVVDGKASDPKPFVTGPASQEGAVFSPDGRYVAFVSNETGAPEVYIRPFPGPGAQQPVSVGGANELAWAGNGELFYHRLDDAALMAVSIRTDPTLSVGQPKELFRIAGNPYGVGQARYAVTRDGQRFLMSTDLLEVSSHAIHIVLNWTAELERLVPTK